MYVTLVPDSWETAQKFRKLAGSWLFRGQADDWKLETLFVREIKDHIPSIYDIGTFRPDRERLIIEEFQRRAQQYVPTPPEEDDYIEWLALIQHYGGPTRLLDFTRSFYVAVFFAIESAKSDAVVWCLDEGVLLARCRAWLCPDGDINTFRAESPRLANSCISGEPERPALLVCEPFRLHERSDAQQSVSLFPCDIKRSFIENLAETFGEPFKEMKRKNVNSRTRRLNYSPMPQKIIIRKNLHYEALQDLRAMNITHRTLFPGLDGLTRSLRLWLRLPYLPPELQRLMATNETYMQALRGVLNADSTTSAETGDAPQNPEGTIRATPPTEAKMEDEQDGA